MTTRREFLQVVVLAGGGFALGLRLDAAQGGAGSDTFRPNAWVRVHPDGRIVVVVGNSEMGQGVRTSLPMLVAEELEVDLDQVELQQASPGPDYDWLGTGGSHSVEHGWEPLRRAGAAARVMLIAAAAERWGATPEQCRAERGRVVELGSSRAATYGELATDAARQKPPDDPPLKPLTAHRLIGTSPRRIDGPELVSGGARYGLDVRLPGQRYAVVARPPVLGGSPVSFDAESALSIDGVEACFEIPSGIAVVARSTWQALRGRDALAVKWNRGPQAPFSSRDLLARMTEASKKPGIRTRRDGLGRDAIVGAGAHLEAVYSYPFAAHASIEPVNSTAHVSEGGCEIWSPTQIPDAVKQLAMKVLGLPAEAVTVHVTLLGGGFGRRLGWDFDREALEVARRVAAPVQLVWTRDDDTRHGYFQAAAVHRMLAGLDEGKLVAWEQRHVSKPHDARGKPTAAELEDADYLRDSQWGVYDNPYAIPHLETSYRVVQHPVPIGPWRAVFAPSSVFARECFLDEIAQTLGRDPLALRVGLLRGGAPPIPRRVELWGTAVDRDRLVRVLETATREFGWAKPPAGGVARGLACDVFHNGTLTAYAVEVSLRRASGSALPFRIERVVGAIDCGVVVNPDGVIQQMESGVVWSLSNLMTEITFENGAAEQSNFDSFRVARLADCPPIEVFLVANEDERPHGVGEPTVSAFAPAVLNALSRLVGKRLRKLPVTASDLA